MTGAGEFPSPNCGARRHGGAPDLVVLHYTAMQTVAAAIARLCDPLAEVSAHYVIAEDGTLTALVDENLRAWHAGAGAWGGICDVNSHSIGIELANRGPDSDTPEFPESQMLALEDLLQGILGRWNIAPQHVIAHSDMAPGRKVDPGPCFDWQRLAAKGLSIWVEAQPLEPDWPMFKTAAFDFGYRAADDAGWQIVLEAFRLRFNPAANGPLNRRDMGLMAELSAQYPMVA